MGIALALLGSFFLAYASLKSGLRSTLLFDQLIHDAPHLSAPWLHAAFILLLIGYGTKMGLAPMHNWKPDAYGEAPGVVGTLLAGGITSCAFLAILRVYQICAAGAEAENARRVMIVMGLLSVAVAAVFMVRQRDFKRMLAYSSVEHMGILVLGIGIGGAAVYGALLHLINNGLSEGRALPFRGQYPPQFRQQAHRPRARRDPPRAALRGAVPGRLSRHLRLAAVWALPQRVHDRQRGASAAASSLATGLLLALLGIVFVGMGSTVLAVVEGDPPGERRQRDPRQHRHRGPDPVVHGPRAACWGFIFRRRWSRCCARRPIF